MNPVHFCPVMMCYTVICRDVKRTFRAQGTSSALPRRAEEMARNRPDHDGSHRQAFDRNKKIIYASQNTCGICGKPVDFSIKYPNPQSACIDHIIPVSKGGHPSDIENLQLAHWICNRQKSDKLQSEINGGGSRAGSGRVLDADAEIQAGLPWSMDWLHYRGG